MRYEYDLNGNRARMVDSIGASNYTYSALNQLLTASQYGDTVSYSYDMRGNQLTIGYPAVAAQVTSGGNPATKTASYSYNPDNSLKTVDWGGSTTTSYSYDLGGKPTRMDYPSAQWTYDEDGNPVSSTAAALTWSYDVAGRPTSQGSTVSNLATHSQSWNAGNMVTADTASSSVGGGGSYSFDSLYRLTAGSFTGRSESFGYDLQGNRTSQTIDGASSSASYDARDRNTGYSYDANGNQLSGGGISTTFDTVNRPWHTTVNSITSEYSYSGDGLRRTKAPDTAQPTVDARTYLWDLSKGTPRVLSDGQNFFVWGHQLIARVSTASTDQHYYHDLRGNVRQVLNAYTTQKAAYSYDSFGGIRSKSDSDTTYKNEFQYRDELTDDTTGMVYLRARYYDPKTGRFIGRDPVAGSTASPQSLNGYAYASNNPVMRSDPSGMEDVSGGDDPPPPSPSGGSKWCLYSGCAGVIGGSSCCHAGTGGGGGRRVANAGYTFPWNIGSIAFFGGAAFAMAYLQNHPQDIFPFPISCSQITLNVDCYLRPIIGDISAGTLRATDLDMFSFTLTVQTEGYIAPIGSTITFTTYTFGGDLFLQQHASYSGVLELGARLTWANMARRLRDALFAARN